MPEMTRYRTARYYHTARTAHLERLAINPPDYFFYSKKRLDFDDSVVPKGVVVERVTCVGLIYRIYRRGVSVLEVPEAMAIKLWPQLFTIHALTTLCSKLGLWHVDLVSYCIENLPVAKKLRAKTKLPIRVSEAIAALAVRYLLSTTRRVVFGTEASWCTYEKSVGMDLGLLVDHVLIWHLPRAEKPLVARGSGVVFVGTFESRKGIFDLIAAWPEVLRRRPESRLTLIGMGAELAHVRKFADIYESVSLIENPSRQLIFSSLESAKVLVLFSRRTALWREQVGLPIVEGLAHGCEIVCSEETGLASWLRANGHMVLPCTVTPMELADAIEEALDRPRHKSAVRSALPSVDGREEADKYLLSVATRN